MTKVVISNFQIMNVCTSLSSITVVYFDQCLGAAHSKRLSKSDLSTFLPQKAEKIQKKAKQLLQKLSKKRVCTQWLVEGFVLRQKTIVSCITMGIKKIDHRKWSEKYVSSVERTTFKNNNN